MTNQNAVTFLSDGELENLGIQTADVADAIEKALLAKAEDRLRTTPKSVIMPGDGRYMMSTLGVGDDGFIVVKQVSVCPDNPDRGLPAINGAVIVLDAHTGLLRAVLGANWITAVRTAALSAVAARRLADPAAETIAFVGTGVQAHSHLDAFSEMFPLKQVRVLGRGKANIDALCDNAAQRQMEAVVCSSPEEVLTGAEMVVTSITMDFATAPFLDANLLPSNAFAAITDACIPWLPNSMGAFGTVVVDDREQERDSANPMVPYDRIAGDLTELVSGSPVAVKKGSPAAFAFRGISLGDYAAAVLAVNKAVELGVGSKISG